VSNIQLQGMKMSHSFRARQKTGRHKHCGSGDLPLLSLPRFGGFFSLPCHSATFENSLATSSGEDGEDIWSSLLCSPNNRDLIHHFKKK